MYDSNLQNKYKSRGKRFITKQIKIYKICTINEPRSGSQVLTAFEEKTGVGRNERSEFFPNPVFDEPTDSVSRKAIFFLKTI